MKLLPLLLAGLLSSTLGFAADDLSARAAEKLIDDLALIDTPALGLHSTAIVLGFIAEDTPLQFGGGVLGSAAPKTPPAMRELVRRGPAILPDLIRHLSDKRPTKLVVGGDFFMFRYFSDEYDPKAWSKKARANRGDHLEKHFDGSYTVKVGDVCYALIGQIVNRSLSPVRYQPSAGLVINSPVEVPALVERVKKDWAGLDAASHKASLIADVQHYDDRWSFGPALVRLRFYYPDDYKRLKAGALKNHIREFEKNEKKPP